MKKLPLLLLALFVLLIGLVSAAAPVINLTLPVNDSQVTDSSTVSYTFNVTGNATNWDCNLNISTTYEPFAYVTEKSLTGISNFSSTTTTGILTADGSHYWMLDCVSSSNSDWEHGVSGVFNYSLAVTAPEINLISPANLSTATDTTARIYTWIVNGSLDTYTCEINTSFDGAEGTFNSVKTITEVNNATPTTSSPGIQTDNGDVIWKVACYNPLDSSIDSVVSGWHNYTLSVLAPVVTLNLPTNDTFTNSDTVIFNWTVVGSDLSYGCDYWNSENGTWRNILNTNVNNGSSGIVKTRKNLPDREFNWWVNCTGETNTVLWNVSSNYTLTVDTINPDVTINPDTPSNYSWLRVNTTSIGLLVIDNNSDVCILDTTLNASGNVSIKTNPRGYGRESFFDYISGTAFNFSGFGEFNLSRNFTGLNATFEDNGTGSYIWSYWCNDSAGNVARSNNMTIFFDTINPGLFNFTAVWTTPGYHRIINRSVVSDYTPELQWDLSIEANFSHYNITFFTNLTKEIIGVQKSVTGRTTNRTNMSVLSADTAYFIDITAYDLAGNSITATSSSNVTGGDFQYNTTSLCRDLNSGWNICGNLGNDRVLSQFLNETGATVASYFNHTNEFVSYVDGGNNGDRIVPSGEAVFMFMGSADSWSDSVHNFSATQRQAINGTSSDLEIITTLRNESNTDWNIVIALKRGLSTTFQEIDFTLNGDGAVILSLNVTGFSKYNNSADVGNKYTGYIANVSFSNDTAVEFGDTIWMFLGDISVKNLTFNWSAIS